MVEDTLFWWSCLLHADCALSLWISCVLEHNASPVVLNILLYNYQLNQTAPDSQSVLSSLRDDKASPEFSSHQRSEKSSKVISWYSGLVTFLVSILKGLLSCTPRHPRLDNHSFICLIFKFSFSWLNQEEKFSPSHSI